MRTRALWVLRAVGDDSALTAVEYAILCGLVVAVAGSAAFWFGQSVHKTSGRVTWTANPSSTASSADTGPKLRPTPSPGSTNTLGATWPWALLSLGVTVGCACGYFGWHYLRDAARHGRTRRRVWKSFADASRQSVWERLLPGSGGSANVRYKRPDTSLIGRYSPELHHWVRGRDVALTAEIVDTGITSRLPQAVSAPPSLPITAPPVSAAG